METIVKNDLPKSDGKSDTEPPKKKPRKSYTFIQKAEVLEKFYSELDKDPNVLLATVANEVDIDKSMLFKWIGDKENIFQKASQDNVCLLKKGRGSNKHQHTFPRLYAEFIKMREKSQKVSFLWFWIKGKKIAKEIKAPVFTTSAVQTFIKKYHLKVRRVQRKKMKKMEDKSDFTEKLKQWHLNFRKGLIKSGKSKPSFDPEWGRFKPHQRYNVDQVRDRYYSKRDLTSVEHFRGCSRA